MGDRLNLGISIEEIEKEAKKHAQSMISDRCQNIIYRELRTIFMEPDTTKDGKPGIGYEMIRNKIDELILSDNFQITIQNCIEKAFMAHFEKALEIAAEKAARKAAFVGSQNQIPLTMQKGTCLQFRKKVYLHSSGEGMYAEKVEDYEISEIDHLPNGQTRITLKQD